MSEIETDDVTRQLAARFIDARAFADRPRRAAHVVLHNRARGLVLLIVRADGLLGLPGGFVDPGETPAQAAARELHEELGLAADAVTLEPLGADARWAARGGVVPCLFVGERSPEQLRELVRRIPDAPHFGRELLGGMLLAADLRRVDGAPAAVAGDPHASLRGVLRQRFAANSRDQLIFALWRLGLLDAATVRELIARDRDG